MLSSVDSGEARSLAERLASSDGIVVHGEPLFPEAGGELSRFVVLRIPSIRFEELADNPFDAANDIASGLGVPAVEPDVAIADRPTPESDILGCWVGGRPPSDPMWAPNMVRAPEAWALSEAEGRAPRGAGIRIGHIDTGVADHNELTGAIDKARGFDFVDDDQDPTDPLEDRFGPDNPGHGTGTASVAVSRAGGRVTGTAPAATLVPIRAIRSVIVVEGSRVARAIDHARRTGCHVITMSLGGLPSLAVRAALRQAVEANLLVLAAAGNCVGAVVWPAAFDDCVAVAGVNVDRLPWRGSSRGPEVDISAPAENVWRAQRRSPDDPLDGVGGGEGTSFAVAILAGVAAVWLAHHGRDELIARLPPGTTLQSRFLAMLRASASRPGGWDGQNYGAGIADALGLLQLGLALAEPEAVAVRQERSWPTMLRDSLARLSPDGAEGAAPRLSDDALARHGAELVWLALSRRVAASRAGAESAAAPAPSRELSRLLASRTPAPAAAPIPVNAPDPAAAGVSTSMRTPGLIAAGHRLPEGPPLSATPGLAIAEPGRFADAVRRDVNARAAGGPEATIGADNKLPFNFLLKGARLGRAVCMIRAMGINYEGASGEWGGTGFLIAPGVLLTNHHVLNSVDVARTARARFDFAADADDRMMPAREFGLQPNRLFVTSPFQFPDGRRGLDYTIVGIDMDEAARREYGFIPAERTSFVAQPGDPANVVHHPGGAPKHVSLQENVVAGLDEQLIHYTTDTERGSSGSPVLSNEWILLALHHSAEPNVQEYNPLREPNAPRLVNEGVRIAAIAVDLEQRVGGSDPHARLALAAFTGVDSALGFFGSLGRTPRDDAAGIELVTDCYRGEADDVDVGFWNIEWFTNRWESKLEEVGRFIADLNLDIWALVESSPEATRRLVEHLRSRWGLEFACAFSEPASAEGKQSTTVLWNTLTVRGERVEWPPEIDRWFGVDSRDFDEVGLEAVHGRIFDRYPGLFRFAALQRDGVGGDPFDFMLVPLHLKAMAEGDLRRRMASRILAAAIRRMQAEAGAEKDWVIGGDFNAELATGAFDALRADGLLPLSAADEERGAFTYLKGPRSLIDHIFLSPNLARTYNGDDFFILAAEGRDTSYLSNLSDHRPVLARLSLRRDSPAASRRLPEDLRAALVALEPPIRLAPADRQLRAVAEAPAIYEPEPPKPHRGRRGKAA